MKMNDRLFLPMAQGEDELYGRIRDDHRGRTHAIQLETMWNEYRDYAPKGFRRKLQFEFHQRWWEMYLTLGLLHFGFAVLSARNDHGPDLHYETESGRVWIEAVAPRIGTKSDRVPEPVANGVADFPKRECLLRLAQGLEEKRKALVRHIDNRTISPNDRCIIALSACDLNQFGSLLDQPCPAPLALLAGAGDLAVTFDGSHKPYCRYEKSIKRDSGGIVDTAMYEREEFRIVSAVLYSNSDPVNAPFPPDRPFIVFLNPRARNPVLGELSFRMETWTEERRDANLIWRRTQPTTALAP